MMTRNLQRSKAPKAQTILSHLQVSKRSQPPKAQTSLNQTRKKSPSPTRKKSLSPTRKKSLSPTRINQKRSYQTQPCVPTIFPARKRVLLLRIVRLEVVHQRTPLHVAATNPCIAAKLVGARGRWPGELLDEKDWSNDTMRAYEGDNVNLEELSSVMPWGVFNSM